MSSAKLHFSRFEFKYVLGPRLRESFESELLYFVELDPHVHERFGGQYFVRSLYFDDPVFSSYYDKIDGILSRAKFRLRTYTQDADERTPVFLERKGRHNNLVVKDRVQLDGAAIYGGPWAGEQLSRKILESTSASAVRQRFEYELHRKRLRPAVLVDYLRRPYVSKYDPEFRITFDSNLVGTEADALFSSSRVGRRILPGRTVMEVKFRHRVPSWFHRLLQSYELRRVSVSKVCRAVETCELASNLE